MVVNTASGPATTAHQLTLSPLVAQTSSTIVARPRTAPGTSGHTCVDGETQKGDRASPADAKVAARAPNSSLAIHQVRPIPTAPNTETTSRK